MALNYTEFLEIKKEDEPLVRVACSTGEITQSDQQTKCGEIFTKNHLDFILICVFCEETYDSMINFGKHYQEKHLSTTLSESMKIKREDNETDFTELLPADFPHYHDYYDSNNEKYEIATNSNMPQPDVMFIDPCSSVCDKEESCEGTNPIDFDENDEEKSKLRFTCSVCTRSYTRKFDLTRHKCRPITEPTRMQKRSGEKNDEDESRLRFTCPVCTRSYTRKFHLAHHKCRPIKERTDEENTIKNSLAEDEIATNSTMLQPDVIFIDPGSSVCVKEESCEGTNPIDLEENDEEESKLRFTCSVCTRSYTRKFHLTHHKCRPITEPTRKKKNIVGEKSGEDKSRLQFTCSVCTRSYTRKFHLAHHKCRPITEPTDEKNTIKTSLAEDTNFFCEICNKQFSFRRIFRRHGLRHDIIPLALKRDPDYLKCWFCGVEFTELKDWREHEEQHGEPPTFLCFQCPKIFKSDFHLRMHMNIHRGQKPFKCTRCPLAFAHSLNLDQHIKRIHLKIARHICEVCNKKFPTRTECKFHKRIHTGEKPFQCEVCGNNFRWQSQLREHRKMHEESRDYKCSFCPAAFYSKSLLKGHMVMHSDKRPFICSVCGRTFKRRVALATHKKLHMDVKQYVCVCGKGFAQLAGLYSHRKSHEKTSLN